MNGQPHKAPASLPSKRERQAAFLQDCERRGLSSRQIDRAASIIPADAPIKVLRWPSF
jgi:hypothetical protein